MKTILITGNGFNYMINDWIKNFPDEYIDNLNLGTKEEIREEIRKITILWTKFNDIFKEIQINNPQITEEELIRLIYSVIDLFSNLPGLEKILDANKIKELKNLFSSFLLDKIKEIAKEFKNHHESTGYKNIKKIFPAFGQKFNEILENKKITFFNIFTTNYDGLLDTLLTGNPSGFIFKDGFSNYNDNLLILNEENINFKKLICHLHGSYLYKKEFGYTFKLRNNNLNTDPIMVFNNPDYKEQIISRDNVLSRYYNILIGNLKEADNLIILGNSMKNEPHLKNLLNQYGNRKDLNVYVCSNNPSKIEDEIKKFYKYNIKQIDTSKFNKQEDFFEFITQIL